MRNRARLLDGAAGADGAGPRGPAPPGLARHKIPKHVEWVESLPRSASGKALKVPLRERYGTPPG